MDKHIVHEKKRLVLGCVITMSWLPLHHSCCGTKYSLQACDHMVECLCEHVVLGEAKTDMECFRAFLADVEVCLSKSENAIKSLYNPCLKWYLIK